LKEIEEILESHFFARVHHSHLVNLNEVNRCVKSEGGYLLMSDGSMVDVSHGKKDQSPQICFKPTWLKRINCYGFSSIAFQIKSFHYFSSSYLMRTRSL